MNTHCYCCYCGASCCCCAAVCTFSRIALGLELIQRTLAFGESHKFIVHLCKKIINFMAAALIIAERISFHFSFLSFWIEHTHTRVRSYVHPHECTFFSWLHFVNRRTCTCIHAYIHEYVHTYVRSKRKWRATFVSCGGRWKGERDVRIREYRNTRDNFQNVPTAERNPFQGHSRTHFYAPAAHTVTQTKRRICQKAKSEQQH